MTNNTPPNKTNTKSPIQPKKWPDSSVLKHDEAAISPSKGPRATRTIPARKM
ncbi:MAG TPA: hypothetical protein VFE98_07075 [Candidatus Bathyarchaeia archaeon]|nr:hypothetical protein [Candidatus Bathyarchaeia archaeon]